MDGSNVDCLFMDLLQEDFKAVNHEAPTLLQQGSCRLHGLNQAYTADRETTD